MSKVIAWPQEQRSMASAAHYRQMAGADFRWTAKRKALLLSAVDEGLLTEAFATIIYGISKEELLDWRAKMESGGLKALRLQSASRPA